MSQKAVQDFYPEDFAQCYGCGRLNEFGHLIKTYWDGDETVTRFTPKPYHTALPGYVYGGLLASLIDCHGTGSAALAAFKRENRDVDTLPPFRFVTASLQVDYLKPTPIGVELEIRGRIAEIKGRKVITEISLFANGVITVRGKVIAVQVPENLINNRNF